MPDVLTLTGPIFLLIGLGFVAVRSGLFPRSSLSALGGFVITFCIPAMIFRALGQRSLSEVANWRYLLAYGLGSLLTLGAGMAWARWRGQSRDAAAMTGMGMSCANSAFIGFPVALQLVGPEAAVALALTMVVENFLMIPLCLALADSAASQHESFARAMARALWGLRKNPIVLGILAGLATALAQWHLPVALAKAADLLAGASAASSLFFVGGTLVGLRVGHLVDQVSAVAVGKLLLHPTAVLGALLLVGEVSAPLQWTAVILAAAPMLSIYSILGQKYGRHEVNAASLLVATVAAFASIGLVIWALQASAVFGHPR